MGWAFTSLLAPPHNPLPGYICVAGGGNAREASFLGPRFTPVNLADGKPPANLALPEGLSAGGDRRRRELRAKLSGRFVQGPLHVATDGDHTPYYQASPLI